MADEATKPGVPDAEVIAEKAEKAEKEAPIADPSLEPGNALGVLRNVDQTILRLNKWELPRIGQRAISILTESQAPDSSRRSLRFPFYVQLLALHPRIPPDQITLPRSLCSKASLPDKGHPERI